MKLKSRLQDTAVIGIIFLLTAAVMVSCLKKGVIYGSQDDWASQHYAIPEYFRTLFYRTHQLFPSYAANLGAGENIYALSYYGLYSPYILLSFCLPFVPMGCYLIGAAVTVVFVSEFLFYVFLRKRFGICASAFAACSFAFSLPLILHSHRHFMFICYMPFLLLSMFLTDRFFRSGRKGLLIFCTFLMILCNYFFALSALAALAAYGFYLVLEEKPEHFRAALRRFAPFAGSLLVSVLMAGVLLLPTAYTLLSGRDRSNSAFSLIQFLPSVHFERLTYYGYTMGATAFGLLAAVYFAGTGRRGTRFIAVLVLLFATCPVFLYLLNGTLYFDAKVLFPFLPLSLLLTAELVEHFTGGETMKLKLPACIFAGALLLSALTCEMSIPMWCLFADTALSVLIPAVLMKLKKQRLIFLCLLLPYAVCLAGSHVDNLQSVQSYRTVNSGTVKALTERASEGKMLRTAIDTERLYTVNKIYSASHYSDTIYSSVHSMDYNRFYLSGMYNENQFRNSALTTRSRNLLFNTYMGDRYYISKDPVSFYLCRLKEQTEDGFYLYENPYAFPMIYFTEKTMSRRQYNQIPYPYNMEALLQYRISEEELPDVPFEPAARKAEIGNPFQPVEYLSEAARKTAEFTADSSRFSLENGLLSYTFPLPESIRGQILLIRFRVTNAQQHKSSGWQRGGDVRIRINGVKNTLTDPGWKYCNHNELFEFVIAEQTDRLDIELTGTRFDLSGLEVYTLDPSVLCSASEALIPFMPDMQKTQGDVIAGSIEAGADGYIATSLVYHKGFTVYVDGSRVKPEKVNLCFLGFPVNQGVHDIRIVYRAPLLYEGMLTGGAGWALFLLLVLLERMPRTKISRQRKSKQ